LYVPDYIAERVRQRAEALGVSVSRFLVDLVKREVAAGWPDGYFEQTVGGWVGDPLVRPAQPKLDEREAL